MEFSENKAKLYSFLVAVVVYLNTLNGDFIHDDIPAILRNKDVKGQSNFLDLFKNDFWGTPMSRNSSHKSYRPVTVALFRLEHLLFSYQPFYYHLTNILLHGAVTVRVFTVCNQLIFKRAAPAFASAIVFGVHPIHTEAVANLVGRAEVLSCMIYLFAFKRYSHMQRNNQAPQQISYKLNLASFTHLVPVFEALLLTTIGTLCKENCATLIALLTVFEIVEIWKNLDRMTSVTFAKCIVRLSILWAGLAVLMRKRLEIMNWNLPHFADADNPASKHPSLKVRFLTYSHITYTNFRILVFPNNLCYDWSYKTIPLITSYYDHRNLATLMFAISIVSLAVYVFYIIVNGSNDHATLYGFMFLVIPYLPASNLFFPVGFVVAERTLYLPSIGFIILEVNLVFLICDKLRRRRFFWCTSMCILALIILTFCWKTWTRNLEWNTKESLFLSGFRTFPQNAKIRYNYANFLRDSGKRELAILQYKEVLNLHPRYTGAINNLALLLEEEEATISEAEEFYARLIRYQPMHKQAYRNLANLKIKQNKHDSAIKILTKLLDLKHDNTEYALEIAKFLHQHNMSTKAERLYKKLLSKMCIVEDPLLNYMRKKIELFTTKIGEENQHCITSQPVLCEIFIGLEKVQKNSFKNTTKLLEQCLKAGINLADHFDIIGDLIQNNDNEFLSVQIYQALLDTIDGSKDNGENVWKIGAKCLQRNQLNCAYTVFEILNKIYPSNIKINEQFDLVKKLKEIK